MTVQQLIDKLNEVKNKEAIVIFHAVDEYNNECEFDYVESNSHSPNVENTLFIDVQYETPAHRALSYV